MKILLVGGTWDFNNGKESKLVDSAYDCIGQYIIKNCLDIDIEFYNGGNYENLKKIINLAPMFDFVFWWANVSNELPKIRNVKEIAPFTMLVNSKRNDNKYDFQELVQRSLAAKANLTFVFKKSNNNLFEITIFDPLGSVWYQGEDIRKAVVSCMDRLLFLKRMTRQGTKKSEESKELVMSWYFDQFKQDEYKSDKKVTVPNEEDFINTVRKYAEQFQKYMPVKVDRFVGNASFKMPPQVGRCGKGMPSFRKDNMIFVSKRNVDKQFITLSNFVPVYMQEDKLMYCGDEKPSVDTPVQVRLYEKLKNINYILHSHCYIKNAPFTSTAIPCGAIEEFDEVMNLIKREYDVNRKFYAINLIGHGSLVMWNNMNQFHSGVEPGLEYYKRNMPEFMN